MAEVCPLGGLALWFLSVLVIYGDTRAVGLRLKGLLVEISIHEFSLWEAIGTVLLKHVKLPMNPKSMV